MSRVLLVSNRMPVTVRSEPSGVRVEPSAGGLATGLAGPHERSGGWWIGWPGETGTLDESQRAEVFAELDKRRMKPVELSEEEVARYYEGFANGVLWPLFHYLLDRVPMLWQDWDVYRSVNERFAEVVAQTWQRGDVVWVHDYQLTLVPGMLRKRIPEARIGYFLHIPFPSSEVFRILPWRREMLEGILGADLVGFHTFSYRRHFASAVLELLGVENEVDRLEWQGRDIRLGTFPMGVDVPSFERTASTPECNEQVEKLREHANGRRILVGVDRLDYTKGIPRRLLAFEQLLQRRPDLRDQLQLIQIAVPSRTGVETYQALRREVEEQVGRINGLYSSLHGTPVRYLFQSVSHTELVALYRVADVMLVTPIRDGMNLVAKEFVASRIDEDGILVLSELAGAAPELGQAMDVNPYDIDGVCDALEAALIMPKHERVTRMRAMREYVRAHDVRSWAEGFVEELERAPAVTNSGSSESNRIEEAIGRVRAAKRALLLLDYDGTLRGFAPTPAQAGPDEELRTLLFRLAVRPGTSVHLVSGRPRNNMEELFGSWPLGLHAEHGTWSKPKGGEWRANVELDAPWKEMVRECMQRYEVRTPGTMIEEKTLVLTWHYRRAEAWLGASQARQLRLELYGMLRDQKAELMPGDKVVEVRASGVHKGAIAERLKREHDGAIVLAMGDDATDEDMFRALGEGDVTIHVGRRRSGARLQVRDVETARGLLKRLVE